VTTARRCVLRSAPTSMTDSRLQQRLAKVREQLSDERVSLARWMSRLRRAFHAIEKHQSRIGRLERRLRQP
jgi:hypothetical protein